MFSLIKLIIWIAGFVVIASFVLGYFGYKVNFDYITQTKKQCEENLKKCGGNLIQDGIKNATCSVTCADPSLIIKKK